MLGKVYKIIDLRNNQPIYIGQTIQSLQQRFKEHISHNSYIAQYMNNNDINNFTIELIEQINIDLHNYDDIIALNDLEKKYIHAYEQQYSLINKINYNSSLSFQDSIKKQNLGITLNNIRCINTQEIFSSIQEACKKYNLSVLSMFKVLQDPNKTLGFDENDNPLHWEYCNRSINFTKDSTYILYLINKYIDNIWTPIDINITRHKNLTAVIKRKYQYDNILYSQYAYTTLATNIISKRQAEILRRLWIRELQLRGYNLMQPLIHNDQLIPRILCIETREIFNTYEDIAQKFNMSVEQVRINCDTAIKSINQPYNFQYLANIDGGNLINTTYAIYAFIYQDQIKYIFYTNQFCKEDNISYFLESGQQGGLMLSLYEKNYNDIKIKILQDFIENEDEAKSLCNQYIQQLIPKTKIKRTKSEAAKAMWSDPTQRQHLLQSQNNKHIIIDITTNQKYNSLKQVCELLNISNSTLRRHLQGIKEFVLINNQPHQFKYEDNTLNQQIQKFNNNYGVYTIDYLSIPQLVFITKGNPHEILQAHKCNPKRSLYKLIQEKGYDKFSITPVQINLSSKQEALEIKTNYIRTLLAQGIQLISLV